MNYKKTMAQYFKMLT